LAAAGLWLAWQLRLRLLLAVSAGLAATALLAAPAAYAVATIGNAQTGAIVAAGPASGNGGPGAGVVGGGGLGGDGAAAVDASLIAYLEANQGDASFLVAAFGSHASAPIIIATGKPVITIGGFSGSDPAPTLEQLQALVAEGKVRFVLVGGGGGFGGGGPGGGNGSITQWVTANAKLVAASTYGGTGNGGTLYDLGGVA
jgi:hypothetical protein